MVFGINVLSRIRRNNDSVCYAPSRAKLPDPSIGSYKLIHPKEDPPIRPRHAPIPDLILSDEKDKNQEYPIDYYARKNCDLLNVPLDYAKKYPIEINLAPPQNGVLNDACKESTDSISGKEDDGDSTSTVSQITSSFLSYRTDSSLLSSDSMNEINIKHETEEEEIYEEIKENEECASVQAQPVIIEEAASSDESEEEVETAVELPESTRWWETVPSLREFAQIKDEVMKALPNDFENQQLISLMQTQGSPIDFIRDFFGSAPPSEKEVQRSSGSDSADQTGKNGENVVEPSLKSLLSDLLKACERVVSELELAAARVSEATAANEQLGASVLAELPDPLSAKFASHHTEVYHISSLMAALSARLARTHDEKARNAPTQEQLNELLAKQKKLQDQLVEARSLKENIDARASLLAAKISHALKPEAYRNYRLFMAVKPRLVIRAKHLQYRIEFEKERLEAMHKILKDENLI